MTDVSAIADSMSKLFGEPEPEKDTVWIDMGYAPLNKILSGTYDRGITAGRMYEIAGPSASGKTLLATMAMIAAQRAGGYAIFVDWERAFSKPFAVMLGLDPHPGRFMYLSRDTWESGNSDAMKAAAHLRKNKLIGENAPIVIVFDSIAAAVPKSVLYDSKTGKLKEIDEYSMNDTTALARVTSTTLKAINQLVAELGVAAIYLNQIRTKPGVVYGDPTTTPGGSAMEFYATTRVFTGRKKIMETSGGEKEFKGALIGLETKKNKLARPFQSVEIRLMYDDDGRAHFDFTTGYIEELIAAGKIEEKSGRVTWDGKSMWKSQLAKHIDENGLQPELVKMLVGS